jgi:ankyrin repeat protein
MEKYLKYGGRIKDEFLYENSKKIPLDQVFYKKYLMYKKKYLALKKLLGGADVIVPCDAPSGFNNTLGTCWNSSVNTILTYGIDGDKIQPILFESSPALLVNKNKKILEQILPPQFKDENNRLTQKSIDLIIQLITAIKKRVENKSEEYEESLKGKKQENVDMIENYKVPIIPLRRRTSITCERDTGRTLFELFGDQGIETKKNEKGQIRESLGLEVHTTFVYFTILNIVLLNRLVYFTDYYFPKKYITIDLSLIEQSFGVIIYVYENNDFVSSNILLNHATSFFICKGKGKYSNNSIIIDHDWKKMFEIIKSLDDSGEKYKLYHDRNVGPYIVLEETNKAILFSPTYQEQVNVPEYHLGNVVIFSVLTSSDFSDPSQFIISHLKFYLSYNKYYKIIEKLIKEGRYESKYIDIQDYYGDTALISAINYNDMEGFQKILALKPNLDLENLYGITALMRTIYNNNMDMLKELLAHKPNLDLQVDGYTALMLTVVLNNMDMLKELLAQNPKPNLDLKTLDGDTVLMMTINYNTNIDMFRKLLSQNPKPNLDLQNSIGYTALIMTIMWTNMDMFRELLAQNPKPNLDLQDFNGESALMLTIKTNKTEMFEQLLAQVPKPNLDLQNSDKNTPLMMTIKYNNMEMFRELLAQNPKPNLDLRDSDGYTALDLAKQKNYMDMVELLEQQH